MCDSRLLPAGPEPSAHPHAIVMTSAQLECPSPALGRYILVNLAATARCISLCLLSSAIMPQIKLDLLQLPDP